MMNGLLRSMNSRRILFAICPKWVSSLFSILLIGVTIFFGGVFSCQPKQVFDSMNGALSYLGVLSSVSLAVLAMLGQFFERKVQSSELSHITLSGSIKSHIKTECLRIIIMASPILAYTITSLAGLNGSKYAAWILASSTVYALSVSVMLPFKYARLMRDYVNAVFDEAEDRRKEKKRETLKEL